MGNLSRPNSNDATGTANRSRSVVPMSGLCSRCVDGCTVIVRYLRQHLEDVNYYTRALLER